MNVSVLAAEGGWQEFELRGGEWLILLGSVATALLALCVGLYLVKGVLAADAGTPKMQEIAVAIQEGAWAYLKRQFRTIGFILVPLAVIVFVSSVAIEKRRGHRGAVVRCERHVPDNGVHRRLRSCRGSRATSA